MSGFRMTFVGTIAATAFTLLFCLIFASVSFSAEPTMTIGCHIRATTQNGMLRLEAVATARRPVTGTYRFEISKESSTGTSQNMQSGAFRVDTDRDQTLTTVILDGSALGHYRAELTLQSPGSGSVSCVSP